MLLGLLKENEAIAKDMPQQQQLQQAVPMPQQQHLQQAMPQQLQQAASQRQAYQQHAVSPQLTLSYGQQVSQQQPQDQMPPPPSYYSAGQAKSMPQQQFQVQSALLLLLCFIARCKIFLTCRFEWQKILKLIVPFILMLDAPHKNNLCQ